MKDILEYFNAQQNNMLSDLKAFIEMETPSTDKTLLDKFADYMAMYIENNLGVKPEIIKSTDAGNNIRLFIRGKYDNQVLLLCHYDTVFPAGTLKSRPFNIKDGKGYGSDTLYKPFSIVKPVY